jgi:trehalose-phosphatase
MQYLFHLWSKNLTTLSSASLVLLLSDYDGTLTPIVSRPEDAVLPNEVREYLSIIVQKLNFSAGIISGRQLSELKQLIGISGIYFAGNHGLEIEGPELTYIDPIAQETRTVLSAVINQLNEKLATTRGVIVEDKGLSMSLHYRLVNENKAKQVEQVFNQITDPLVKVNSIKITSGKKVWEVRPPVNWHKGKAVELITRKIAALNNQQPDVVIYLGDDTTDEDAFSMVNSLGGWSIYVGPVSSSSQAIYHLASPGEVADFLSRLAGL